MTIYDEYFKSQTEFLSKIKTFENKRNINLTKMLAKIENTTEFLSTISEIRFGLFFDAYCSEIKYETNIDGKTPDWFVKINNQNIIAEVRRLNPTRSDHDSLAFTDAVLDSLNQIQHPYWLYVDYSDWYTEEQVSMKTDISELTAQVENWLNIRRNPGDTFNYKNLLEITVHQNTSHVEHVLSGGLGGPSNIKLWRLSGNSGVIMEKVKAYKSLIDKNKLPFIVCIKLDIHTWINEEDVYFSLLGSPAEFEQNGYSYHDLSNALFYQYGTESKCSITGNISGILLLYQEKLTFFPNPRAHYPLSIENRNAFKELEYTYPE